MKRIIYYLGLLMLCNLGCMHKGACNQPEVEDIDPYSPLALSDSLHIDSIRMDSIWKYMAIGFSNLNEFQVKVILTDYILYCHDEDGVEGILVEYGSAFINDDTFYDWALSVYQELNGRNEERYKRWVAMSVEGYIEVWYNFRLSEDKFRDFISSLDMEQLQDIRNMFHNGNYEFMEPFIPK